MLTLTDRFIEGVFAVRDVDYKAETVEKAKFCLLDYLGVALAGSVLLGEKVGKLLELLSDANHDGLVIGKGFVNNLQNAVFVNGLNSHYLELDDGIRYGVIHPGAPLFSALIPVAANMQIGWRGFLMGILCGYEASIRVAASVQPTHYSKGYHPSATCCPIGVAVGLASMLNLSKKEMKDAVSCASVSAGGSLKVLEDTSELKIFNVGRAAKLGYLATVMAKAGFAGPNDALAGDTGFLSMMADSYNEEMLIREAGEELFINKVYLKPYASCRHTHAAVEAALKIRSRVNVDIDNIAKLRIETYKGVIGKHDGNDIYGGASAKMSIPYSVAVALAIGNADMEAFEEPYLSNPSILKLTKLISVIPDEFLSSLVPHKRVAIVTITTKDGKEYSERVEYPRGEPENPLSREELFGKFKSLARMAGKTDEQSEEIIETIFSNEDVDMNKLFTSIQ